MNCIHLKIRTKQYEKYIYCKQKRKKIIFKDCINCKHKEFKQVKELKKKSNKLKQLEAKRYSILTNNLNICYICHKRRKDDIHEIFGGSNRQISMKYGLTIPTCRECHSDWDTDKELRKRIQEEAKQKFYKLYSEEKFLKEFGKKYI